MHFRTALAALAALAFAGPATAQPLPGQPVRVPLVGEPLPEEAFAERTVRPGEPFLVQRLSALRSVTLQADAALPIVFASAKLAQGAQLFLAQGARGAEFWCGPYTPAGLPEWAGGAYKVQWVCLEDADGDLDFDSYYSTPDNAGAYLPSFTTIRGPRPLDAPIAYTHDEEGQRAYYEMAVIWEKSFNIYNRLFFYSKVRRAGEDKWSNVASITKGVTGGYITTKQPPQAVNLNGAKFQLISREGDDLRLKPEAVSTGVRSYGLLSFGF